MPAPKRQKKCEEGAPAWLLSWGDLTTLLLTFFVIMYDVGSIDQVDLNIMLSAFQGLGPREGGNTLEAGKLAELGNTVMSLPAMEKGQSLARAKKTAVSVFQPEIKARKVRIKEDERGLIISLASDAYFRPASADVNIEESRTLLQNLALLLSSGDLAGRTFRIEGHTEDKSSARFCGGGPGFLDVHVRADRQCASEAERATESSLIRTFRAFTSGWNTDSAVFSPRASRSAALKSPSRFITVLPNSASFPASSVFPPSRCPDPGRTRARRHPGRSGRSTPRRTSSRRR